MVPALRTPGAPEAHYSSHMTMSYPAARGYAPEDAKSALEFLSALCIAGYPLGVTETPSSALVSHLFPTGIVS